MTKPPHVLFLAAWVGLAAGLLPLGEGSSGADDGAEPTTSAAGGSPPNVVYILADDLGWGDLGIHGSDIPTPTIDAFFSESVQLTQFVAATVCSPTRAGFLTSRDPLLLECGPKANGTLSADELTLAKAFQNEGYVTGCFGKWHNGEAVFRDENGDPVDPPKGFERMPGTHTVNEYGFDEWAGFYWGLVDYLTKFGGGIPNWFRNELYVPDVWDTEPDYFDDRDDYVTDLIADYAVEFIQDNSSEPFFCYVPFSAPHSPLMFRDPNNPDPRIPVGRMGDDRKYAEMVILLDDAVQRILDELDTQGLRDQTVVVFTSDNGGSLQSGGDNGPFREGKHSVYDGGVHVPTALRYPDGGYTAADGFPTFGELMGYLDMFPTLFGLCGLTLPPTDPDKPLAGFDVFGMGSPPHYIVHSGRGGEDMVRTRDRKYVRDGTDEYLFDLVNDLGETNDISGIEPVTFAALKQVADDYIEEHELTPTHISMEATAVGLPAPSGEILKVTVDKTGVLAEDYLFRIGPSLFMATRGGFLEYDLYIPSDSTALRFNMTQAIDADDDWLEIHRAVDQRGNSYEEYQVGSFSNAFGQWSRYRIGTGNLVPQVTQTPHVRVDSTCPNGTFTFYVDNVLYRNLFSGVEFPGWTGAEHTDPLVPPNPSVMVTIETVDLTDLDLNGAVFESASVPLAVGAGRCFDAIVTYGNIGSNDWTAAQFYQLKSQDEPSVWTEFPRVPMGPFVTTRPGETYTFDFPCTAPVVPGFYDFQWRMTRSGVGSFGEVMTTILVEVSDDPNLDAAHFVSMSAPDRTGSGASFPVALRFKNIGNTTWQPGTYELGAQNPEDNTTWTPGRIPLDAPVAPGETYEFAFDCTAPVDGTYDFQWQLVRGASGWFGQRSENKEITTLPCYATAAVSTRNAGSNPVSYTASPPVLGGTFTATVDLTTTGHAFAIVLGYATPASITLGGGQVLLVNLLDPAGEVYGFLFTMGPIAEWTDPVTDNPAFCGMTISSQAIHFGGETPFAMSNAQDTTIGL